MATRQGIVRYAAIACLFAIMTCSICTLAAPPEDVVSWLGDAAIRLSSAEVTDDLADLEPLRELVGGVRVVGLGEQTHGTREFTTLRHRIVRFLVQEMGFDAVIIERHWTACLYVDDYVQGRRGSIEHTMEMLASWLYETESFLDLVEWMHSYNEGLTDSPIHLVGMDMHRSAYFGPLWVCELLRSRGHPLSEEACRPIAGCASLEPSVGESRSQEDFDQYMRNLEPFLREIPALLPELDGVLSTEELAIVEHTIREVQQFADYQKAILDDAGLAGTRDASMAENVLWWLDLLGDDSKAVVWAHNDHITKNDRMTDYPRLGALLHESLGDAYFALGFSAGEGTLRAYDCACPADGSRIFELPSASRGSIEELFQTVDAPAFLLDLRETEGTDGAWIRWRRPFRLIGACLTSGLPAFYYSWDTGIHMHFDAIAHVNQTMATRLTSP